MKVKNKILKMISAKKKLIKASRSFQGLDLGSFAISHIVGHNPIIHADIAVRKEYLEFISKYMDILKSDKDILENALIRAYEKIILDAEEIRESQNIQFYKYYILLDVYHIISYKIRNIAIDRIDKLREQYYGDFILKDKDKEIIDHVIDCLYRLKGINKKRCSKLSLTQNEIEYINLIRKNIAFKSKRPFEIMVTATMSAGKSTFINALTGKYISLSQNMACTSKIHTIINKTFEDNYSYEFDYDLIMTAGTEELINDNENNKTDIITVGTYFNGDLSKERIIVNDSPGVNFSGDKEHKETTERLIKAQNYDLIIYLMNATQLSTNDEDEYLEFIKNSKGGIPIIFVINKIDGLNEEEENINSIINKQIEFLQKKGFTDPIVCPVSSKAGYLSKKFFSEKLTRTEEREFYNYIDKFERMRLSSYYNKLLGRIRVRSGKQEEEKLSRLSGLSYLEKIIKYIVKGAK